MDTSRWKRNFEDYTINIDKTNMAAARKTKVGDLISIDRNFLMTSANESPKSAIIMYLLECQFFPVFSKTRPNLKSPSTNQCMQLEFGTHRIAENILI